MRRLSLVLCAALAACSSGTDTGAVENHGSISGAAKFAGDTGDQSGIAVLLAGATPGATVTDGSGGYSFAGLAPGTYFVTAESADSLERSVRAEVQVTKDKSTTAPALQLTPAGSISGSMLRPSGTDHGGITVAVLGTNVRATTAASGAFVIHGLAAGPVTLVADDAGQAGATVTKTITRGATADAGSTTLTAFSGARKVSGKVVDSAGAGVPGVGALLTGATTAYSVTDASGAFAFQKLSAGTYRLAIVGPDVAPHETDLVVTVGASDVALDDTVVQPVGAIAGTVGTAGLAQKLPAVAILQQGGDAQGLTALVQATGAFTLRDVPVGTGYAVVITGGGATSAPADSPDVARGQTSVIAASITLPDSTGGASVELRGQISLVGGSASELTGPRSLGGASVDVDLGSSIAHTTTQDDGSWSATVSTGGFPISISAGLYGAQMPPVLALPGTHGLTVDGTTYPLSSTLELQAGDEWVSSGRIGGMCPSRNVPNFYSLQSDHSFPHVTMYLTDYECPASLLPGGSSCQGQCCNGCCIGDVCATGKSELAPRQTTPTQSQCLGYNPNNIRRTHPGGARET
ncbi:MAG: carboxypeptidase regulatory-like domain-containing protein, partial [Deltaproteobacteria bacterium]|nr:carboxypeptidase regulatory-like domain-containing protein [Deltaproteobacteria bacterium]